MKIAVFGAGGFVGSTLCERLYFEREHEFVPVVHGFGGAARLARLPIAFKTADVLDESQLRSAMQGCDAIVNCSRGNEAVMEQGARNLIKAARASGISRLIHVSSIAIYGSEPPADSGDESATPQPDDPYGVWKLNQDKMLLKAHGPNLKVLLLCPANIYGPYSPFIVAVVKALKQNTIKLVDGGKNPTNNVHVNNIVEAMLAALRTDNGWGQRYFVNEPERTTWAQFYGDLAGMLGIDANFESIPVAAAYPPPEQAPPRTKFTDNFKIMLSGEFRKALGVLPAIASLNKFIYSQGSRLNPALQDRIRSKIARPTIIQKQAAPEQMLSRFVTEQRKPVFHSPARIMKALDFQPFSYRQGMETIREWLTFGSDLMDQR